jgi:hypothetical protein
MSYAPAAHVIPATLPPVTTATSTPATAGERI